MQIDISILLSIFGMLISAGGFGVTINTVVKSNAKNEANRAAEMATLHNELKHQGEDIKELSGRVDKHNKVVERTFELEGAVRENQHDISELKTDTREIKNKLINMTRR